MFSPALSPSWCATAKDGSGLSSLAFSAHRAGPARSPTPFKYGAPYTLPPCLRPPSAPPAVPCCFAAPYGKGTIIAVDPSHVAKSRQAQLWEGMCLVHRDTCPRLFTLGGYLTPGTPHASSDKDPFLSSRIVCYLSLTCHSNVMPGPGQTVSSPISANIVRS